MKRNMILALLVAFTLPTICVADDDAGYYTSDYPDIAKVETENDTRGGGRKYVSYHCVDAFVGTTRKEVEISGHTEKSAVVYSDTIPEGYEEVAILIVAKKCGAAVGYVFTVEGKREGVGW
ncbi:MAG: hypothetical protein OXU73_00840 [Candidatus Campbellbacteria bacterium]|nr:hypothetical protein [Candidatus Campbellbacteria bacterium]